MGKTVVEMKACPRKPTAEMLRAAQQCAEPGDFNAYTAAQWQAMFDAAPAVPHDMAVDTIKRAEQWLRICSGWMMSNDLDMGCPMLEDPLDLADDLAALSHQQPETCSCFGDTRLQASTYQGDNGKRHCDLCGKPVAHQQPAPVAVGEDGDPCPSCGALPCDWVNNPFRFATTDFTAVNPCGDDSTKWGQPIPPEGEDDVAREALTHARDTFLRYARIHREKGTDEGDQKACANASMAEEMDRALAARAGQGYGRGIRWRPISEAPQDGSIFYTAVAMKWKPYKANSEQARRGIKGRWVESNGYGGWTPSVHKPELWVSDALAATQNGEG